MDFKEKLKDKKRLTLLIFLILLSLFNFGLGFLVGSRFYEPNPIIIQKNE